MKNVLILGYDKFPNGDAGAVRMESFAKILQNLNHNVVVAELGESTNFKYSENNGIKYISLRHYKTNVFNRACNIIFYIQRLKKYVLKHFEKFDYILLGWCDKKIIDFAKRYAKKHNAKVIIDAVEWFSKEQFKNGEKSKAYKRNDKMNRIWIDNSINVISISSYLHEHFVSRNVKSTRIPVILDVDNITYEKTVLDNKIVISYAGMPSKKDYFAEILQGLLLLSNEELEKFKFRIMGVTLNVLKSTILLKESDWERLSSTVNCLGRVPRSEVFKNLSESDFTILVRSEKQRYAKAGFPTKVPESLSTATPVICNITSDLGKYLVDGENSFIIKSLEPNEIARVFKKVIKLDLNERKKLFENARKTAEEFFNYKNYENNLKEIL